MLLVGLDKRELINNKKKNKLTKYRWMRYEVMRFLVI